MGLITISLNDEVERLLRKLAKELYGNKKGALSKVIETAIKDMAAKKQYTEKQTTYRAYKNNKLVVEASTLDELAKKLDQKGVDPREVRILAGEEVKPRAKIGYRMK